MIFNQQLSSVTKKLPGILQLPTHPTSKLDTDLPSDLTTEPTTDLSSELATKPTKTRPTDLTTKLDTD